MVLVEVTSDLLTVRALVTDLRSEPNSPIPDTDSGCLPPGSNVEIVCENIALPVGEWISSKMGILSIPPPMAGECVYIQLYVIFRIPPLRVYGKYTRGRYPRRSGGSYR